jgi:hypothetical protein
VDLGLETDDVLDGKYVVEDVIGEGGMGVVVSARHLALDTPVAIKVLRPQARGVWRQRFLREARAASQLDNEHVAKVYDIGQLEDGTPYMVMELLVGCDLADVVYGSGPLDVETTLTYAKQVCAALVAAHAHGIVHRDVKPANLFLTHRDDGSPCIKLLDFGISKVQADERSELTCTGSFLGSPQFMSPEQLASSRDVDVRSDLWSLGASLFELLTANAAFGGDTVPELYSSILRDGPRRLRDYRPDAPLALQHLIEQCLNKDADQRVQSARQLAELLELIDLDDCSDDGSVFDDTACFDEEREDETPGPTIRPTTFAATQTQRPSRLFGGALLACGLIVGAAAAGAVAATVANTSAKLEPLALQLMVATAHVVESAPVQANPDASPFVESGMLGEPQRAELAVIVARATDDLESGYHDRVVDAARQVMRELKALGISPNKAVSSLGAKSQLLLGRVHGFDARDVLDEQPATQDARAWANQVDLKLAHTRVAYERVAGWGVRSFYRCGLVEMAALDRAASEAIVVLADGHTHRNWFLARARRHRRHARTSLRHALQVKAETMLCVNEARSALHELDH